MINKEQSIMVSDTSVLVNFLRIERVDLIADHSYEFLVTDHVSEEITDNYPAQLELFECAVADGILRVVSVTDAKAVALFARLSSTGTLGAGECSAIALSVHGGYSLAIDDKRAAKQARSVSSNLKILRTQELVASMIQEDLLTVAEADAMKDTWSDNHRFRLPFNSFNDIL